MKCTFGDFGEDSVHRINPCLRIHFQELDHFHPVGQEFTPHEAVSEQYLPANVDDVEKFAQKEMKGPKIVMFDVFEQIIGQLLLSTGSGRCFIPRSPKVQSLDDIFDFVIVQHLPHGVRSVKHHRLSEQYKGNPLIISVVLELVRVVMGTQTLTNKFVLQSRIVEELGYGVSRRYEAVTVDHFGGDDRWYDAFLDALNVIPGTLHNRHEDGRAHQQDESGSVVQAEDGRINPHFTRTDLDDRFQFAECQHQVDNLHNISKFTCYTY